MEIGYVYTYTVNVIFSEIFWWFIRKLFIFFFYLYALEVQRLQELTLILHKKQNSTPQYLVSKLKMLDFNFKVENLSVIKFFVYSWSLLKQKVIFF